MTIDALTPLVQPLLALDFEHRVEVAHRLGLNIACCGSCGCYAGAPYCGHPADETTDSEHAPCGCEEGDDEGEAT